MLQKSRELPSTLRAGGFPYTTRTGRRVQVENKVLIGDRLNPADCLKARWVESQPLAADVTVAHFLPPRRGPDGTAAGSAAALKEARKVAKYDDLGHPTI